MQEKLISIITPIYNGERFVSETIESVLSQTYTNWEMIIINDGSKDNSESIVKEYCNRDNRIQLHTQPNAGSAAARNNGIRRANGRYIALLDADDTWEPNFIESQLNLMRREGAQLVCAAHKRINSNGEEVLSPFYPPQYFTYKDMLKTCHISCLTGVYDSKQFGKIYLNENFGSLRDDYVYWLEIIKKTEFASGNQEVIASYRILDNSATSKKSKMIKPQYRVYREVEKLGLISSLYYLVHWAVNGFIKYNK